MFIRSAFPTQVGLHINHHLILHCQLGCLPDSPEDGGANRVSGRPGWSDSDRVRHHARRIHNDLLPGLHTLLYIIHCLLSSVTPTYSSTCTAQSLNQINGASAVLSSSSPSCPSCLPLLTTGFICFLSVLCYSHSISFSLGRWALSWSHAILFHLLKFWPQRDRKRQWATGKCSGCKGDGQWRMM